MPVPLVARLQRTAAKIGEMVLGCSKRHCYQRPEDHNDLCIAGIQRSMRFQVRGMSDLRRGDQHVLLGEKALRRACGTLTYPP